MAKNTVLPNLKLVRKKGLGTLQIRLHWRTGPQSSIEMTWSLRGDPYRFFTNRSTLEMG